MNKRIVEALAVVGLTFVSCVHEITSDERLERDTGRSNSLKSASAGELSRLKCDDINAELVKARDEGRTEEARLATYGDLFDRVKSRNLKFDDAMSRNPDLAYQEGSETIVSAHEGCIQSQADVKLDYEGLVRDILNMPTVDEIRSGSMVKVARVSFDTLRSAIEKLEFDDRESLVTKVNNAEKQVDVKDSKRRREK